MGGWVSTPESLSKIRWPVERSGLYLRWGIMTRTASPSSEFSATPIRLEDFVQRPAWSALPLPIQLAVIHLWRSEQDYPALEDQDSEVAALVGESCPRDLAVAAGIEEASPASA
jgi:hypothetical protein